MVSDWVQIAFTGVWDWLQTRVKIGFRLCSNWISTGNMFVNWISWWQKSLINGKVTKHLPKSLKNQHVTGPAAIDKTRKWPSTCKNQHVNGQLAIDKKQRRTNANVYNHDVIQTYLKHPETNYIRTWSRVCGFRYGWNWFQVAFLFGLFAKGISKVSSGAWMDGCSPSASVAFQGFSLDGLIGRIKAFQTCFRPKNGQRRIVQNNQCYFLGFQTGFRLLSEGFETGFQLELKIGFHIVFKLNFYRKQVC